MTPKTSENKHAYSYYDNDKVQQLFQTTAIARFDINHIHYKKVTKATPHQPK
jgi:hypothetical protein